MVSYQMRIVFFLEFLEYQTLENLCYKFLIFIFSEYFDFNSLHRDKSLKINIRI